MTEVTIEDSPTDADQTVGEGPGSDQARGKCPQPEAREQARTDIRGLMEVADSEDEMVSELQAKDGRQGRGHRLGGAHDPPMERGGGLFRPVSPLEFESFYHSASTVGRMVL